MAGDSNRLWHGVVSNDEVLAAVEEDASVLEFASREFQNCKKIVWAAVKTHGAALVHAFDELSAHADVFQLRCAGPQQFTARHSNPWQLIAIRVDSVE